MRWGRQKKLAKVPERPILITYSVFLATKHAARGMMKTSDAKPHPSGSIIGTASVAGLRSNAGATDYSASKAAVVSIMQTVAYQLVGTGIRCNAVCPGIIETGMTSLMYDAARQRGTERKIGQLNPLMRGGVADEVARVVAFLGSDSASYVNGQAWAVSHVFLGCVWSGDANDEFDRWMVDLVQATLLYRASWHDTTDSSICKTPTMKYDNKNRIGYKQTLHLLSANLAILRPRTTCGLTQTSVS